MSIRYSASTTLGPALMSTIVACSAPKPRRPSRRRTADARQRRYDQGHHGSRKLAASGTAEPVQQATLSTKLMGTVTAVLVHEGESSPPDSRWSASTRAISRRRRRRSRRRSPMPKRCSAKRLHRPAHSRAVRRQRGDEGAARRGGDRARARRGRRARGERAAAGGAGRGERVRRSFARRSPASSRSDSWILARSRRPERHS